MNNQNFYQESGRNYASYQHNPSDNIPVNGVNTNFSQHNQLPIWPPSPSMQQPSPCSVKHGPNQGHQEKAETTQHLKEGEKTKSDQTHELEGHDLPIPITPGAIPGYRNPAFDDTAGLEVVSPGSGLNGNTASRKRKRLWIILAIILIILVALGVGIALGVVLGRKHHKVRDDSTAGSQPIDTRQPSSLGDLDSRTEEPTQITGSPTPTTNASREGGTVEPVITSFASAASTSIVGAILSYTTTCTWINHCPGDRCSGNDFCDGSSTCEDGICAWCSERNRCIGDTCGTDEDCSLPWKCVDGACANVLRIQAR